MEGVRFAARAIGLRFSPRAFAFDHQHNAFMRRSAVFSDCGRYRYLLRRVWNDARPALLFIALNPSTADAVRDDPTIRRCIGFARDLNFGGVWVANLFAYRTTDPKRLATVSDPVGPRNDWQLFRAASRAGMIIAAWGAHGALRERAAKVAPKLENLHCLGRTRDGHPRHPLYLPMTARPLPFSGGLQ